jgi:molecular chaperone GrpE
MTEQSSRREAASNDELDAASGETSSSSDAAGEQELAAARAQAAENWDKYLLAAADLENIRRRAARDLENARKYGNERLAQALLPVRDSLEAGLQAENADLETLIEGTRATLRLLQHALESAGVREIDPQDQPFDPSKHEAIAIRVSGGAPNMVVEVVQKGYELNERLLRPARVVVSQSAE